MNLQQQTSYRRILRLRTRPRSGATVVELAVTLPVLVLMLFGMIEFGRAMMVHQVVTNAARMGARRAILLSSTNAEVQQKVKDACRDTIGVDPTLVTVDITVQEAPGHSPAADQLVNAQQGDACTVSVSVPYGAVSFASPQWLSGQSLTGICTMEKEE